MKTLTRRRFIASTALVGGAALAGCTSDGSITGTGQQIDTHVAVALQSMYRQFDGSQAFAQRAVGMLVIPNITKAGLFLAGSYGEGALLIGGATVDYFSFASASFGLQIGAQQSTQVLFFMTSDALRDFRASPGFQVGLNAEVVAKEDGGNFGISSTTSNKPILGIVFGQRGLLAGASLEGAKYSRLVR
ncbi:MAG: twin-arginine translocation pathway signal [Rhodobacteraceae bacterium]|nr:twin-arginine translocation pathway signal [Paracoccaceae bacterium]